MAQLLETGVDSQPLFYTPGKTAWKSMCATMEGIRADRGDYIADVDWWHDVAPKNTEESFAIRGLLYHSSSKLRSSTATGHGIGKMALSNFDGVVKPPARRSDNESWG